MDEDKLGDGIEVTTGYMNVVLRDYDPSTDQACLYATWRNAAYYGAKRKHQVSPKTFFKRQTTRIDDILTTAETKVACLEDDPTLILGYSVFTGSHLNWVYVKKDYRNKGIGELLVPKHIETVTDSLTKIGDIIATKKKLKLKENEDATRNP